MTKILSFDNISKFILHYFDLKTKRRLPLMDINQRIRLIINALELNNNTFAKAINVNPVVTHNIISGRLTKPSYELLEKILLTYDNINADWLICGRGDMFIDRKSVTPRADSFSALDILNQQLTEVNHTNRELLSLLKKNG